MFVENPFLFCCSSLAFAGSRWNCSLQDGAPPSFAAGGQEIALQRWRSQVEIAYSEILNKPCIQKGAEGLCVCDTKKKTVLCLSLSMVMPSRCSSVVPSPGSNGSNDSPGFPGFGAMEHWSPMDSTMAMKSDIFYNPLHTHWETKSSPRKIYHQWQV